MVFFIHSYYAITSVYGHKWTHNVMPCRTVMSHVLNTILCSDLPIRPLFFKKHQESPTHLVFLKPTLALATPLNPDNVVFLPLTPGFFHSGKCCIAQFDIIIFWATLYSSTSFGHDLIPSLSICFHFSTIVDSWYMI
jgi:hypothetical protein